MIRVHEVSKSFVSPQGASLSVLKKVSFSIGAGEAVAIQGPSGSGKSTLLSLLAGLDVPSSGGIEIDGEAIHRKSELELSAFRSRKLGFVFQSFQLLQNFSALQNVVIAAEIAGVKLPKKAAHEALERVGLGSRLKHLPTELSGGESQRVAIARAIVTEPKVILADEPTGSLDPDNAQKVFDLLLELNRERNSTLVLVTHDEGLARQLGRGIRLSRGEMVNP